MIDRIIINNEIYAIVIKKNYKSDGIEFFTPKEFSQQLAYMKRPKNYEIKPHIHHNIIKEVKFTQEVLFIKSGKIRVDFYNKNKKYIKSKVVEAGDIILLSKGGHGFKVIEEGEIIEVKQGPYDEKNDKSRFDGINDEDININ